MPKLISSRKGHYNKGEFEVWLAKHHYGVTDQRKVLGKKGKTFAIDLDFLLASSLTVYPECRSKTDTVGSLNSLIYFNTYVAMPSLISTHDKFKSSEAETSFLLATFKVSVMSNVRLSVLT